jgi:5'-nucleotidase
VTQADWKGRFLTDIDLILSKETGDVVAAQAKNVAVTRDVPKDPDVSKIVEKYSALAAPLANKVIGSIKSSITKDAKASGESALGDVIADAQLYATAETERAVAAFMNPGGIRSDLIYNSGNKGLPENVTYADAFSVQPFSNALVTMNLTGSQIDKLLEQQFDNPGPGEDRVLQVSKGFSYTRNRSAPTGEKVDINSIKIESIPISANSSYRITVNNFLADGGDNFEVLTAGTNPIYGAVDLEALVEYFKAFSPISPGPTDRIKVVP